MSMTLQANRFVERKNMSVSGITSTLFDSSNQTVQNNMQQFKQEFQQVGQDLQSGNLSAAQADFVTLQQLGPKGISDPTIQSGNPLSQAFNKLSQELSSGNVSVAQQDYAKIQQAFQNQASGTYGHHHHHHGGANGENAISQLMNQQGQALQSGDLSSAQTAYNSLLQDYQQASQSNDPATGPTTQSNGVSLNA
jgi:hypothetical protein